MEFFICKKVKKIISVKHCQRSSRLGQCRDANGVLIHCVNGAEAVASKKYTMDDVFDAECVKEYKVKCMSSGV